MDHEQTLGTNSPAIEGTQAGGLNAVFITRSKLPGSTGC